MKKSYVSDPIIRKAELHRKDRRRQVGKDTIIVILILIILMMVGLTGYYLGKTAIILSRVNSYASAMEFDDSMVDKVDLANLIQVIPTEPIKMGLPLPDPKLADGKFKTYMDYRAITRKSSPQYQLQKLSWTDEDGFRRYEHYYLIALGSAYTNQIGETFDIILSSQEVKHCMIGDVKADKDTDKSNRFIEHNGNIVEFIIDREVMDREVLSRGDISSLGFEGSITTLIRTEYEDLKP